MTGNLKIEKNIPIPKKYRSNTKSGETINKMEVGDCVTVEGKNAKSCFYAAMRKKGYKAATREVSSEGYGIYRIWRTE